MLLGHDDKTALFTRLVREGTLGHAYLFFGDAGVGKRSFAEYLGNLLERGVSSSEAPLIDTQVFSRATGERSLGIETVRLVRHFLGETPFASSRRFAIIDDGDTMTAEAQSAFLKIVEEPGSYGAIIFIARDAESLFPALRSRLTPIYFRRLSRKSVAHALQETYRVPPPEAEHIAERSFGSMGRALTFLKEKRKEEKEARVNLAPELDEEIISLYLKDPIQKSRIIISLLGRVEAVKRYNLNEPLQRKAAQYAYHDSR